MMNNLIEPLFKNWHANATALTKYGFVNGQWTTPLLDDFTLTVSVLGDEVSCRVFDEAAQAPYTLFVQPTATGRYVAKVRDAVITQLTAIRDACFTQGSIYHQPQTLDIIAQVAKTYALAPEFLWQKFPTNAVFRRTDSKKWFAAILTVQPDRIGRTGKKPLEILDLRMADPLQVDGVNFLPGYHMNKKSWFTVVLDGTVATEQLMALMATSFDLAAK